MASGRQAFQDGTQTKNESRSSKSIAESTEQTLPEIL